VAIHTAKKTRLLGDGLMVYDWCFVGEGLQVALSTGTVHGMTSRHLLLYDSRSALLLEEWNEEMGEALPTWQRTSHGDLPSMKEETAFGPMLFGSNPSMS
jgi:hypothetical protein